MKTLLCVVATVCIATVPSLLRAHNGMEHVMGTVKSIAPTSITMETTKKKEVVVVTDEKTSFERSGKPAAAHDLTIGERIVVHAKKSEKGLTAEIVKWGQPDAAHRHGTHDDKGHDHDHPKK